MSPITRDLCWNFIVTLIPLPIYTTLRGCVCVRACAEVHADHGERTSSTGSDQDPSADLAPFLLPCHRSSSTYHDHYFHRGLRPHPANGREAARLTSSSGERSPRSPLSSLDDVPTLQFRILSNHSLQARCRCDALVGSDSGEREGEKTLPVRRSGRLAREYRKRVHTCKKLCRRMHRMMTSVVSGQQSRCFPALEEVEDPQVAGLPFARRSRLHFASDLARSAFQLIEQFDRASLQLRAQDQPPSCVLLTRRRNSSSSWLLFRRLLQSLPLRCSIRPSLR